MVCVFLLKKAGPFLAHQMIGVFFCAKERKSSNEVSLPCTQSGLFDNWHLSLNLEVHGHMAILGLMKKSQ